MAKSAVDPRGPLPAFIELFHPTPGRVRFAVRLALICALTTLVTEIYQTPEPALTAYVVFFLNRTDRTTSVIMNIALVILISVIIGLVLLVARMVADDAMWRVVSIAVISFALLFLASASKLRPVAGTFALIVGYALDLLGMVPVGEAATRGLLYAWLFVGIPAGVSLIVNLLIAPAPRRLAEAAIAERLEISAAMLRAPDPRVRRRLEACLREGAAPILGHLKLAGVEHTAAPADIAALEQAALSSVVLLSAVDVADRNPEAVLPSSLREPLAVTLGQMAAIFRAGGYPLEPTLDMPARQGTISPLAACALASIKDAVTRFADPSGEEVIPPKEAGGFFEKDAFTNPDHIHYALKTTAAALFCYVLYSLLDWPCIHTCFLTCYIVSLGTTAESVEKLVLRIAGCLVGAAAGIAAIVYLVPSLTSIGGLLTTVFLGALACAYVAAGSARISYAGFQMAFAFFLCVVQGAGPSFDMVTARDRVIGILLGNLVVYVLFTHLWPVTVSRRIDPAIAAALKRLSAMAAPALRGRPTLPSEVQATLGSIEADIDLAGYEPPSLRPAERWLATRRDAALDIGALAGLLLLPAEQSVFRESVARRLSRLAERLDGAHDARPRETPELPLPEAQPLRALVELHMQRLERSLGETVLGPAEVVRHAT